VRVQIVAREADADVLGVFLPEGRPSPVTSPLADAGVGRVAYVQQDGRTVALAGIGLPERLDLDAIRTAAGAVARRVAEQHASLAWELDESLPLSPAEQARAVVEGVALGAYDPGVWRSARSRREVPSLTIVSASPEAAAAAERAALVSEFVTLARDLANAPPNVLTPAALAERAAELEGVEIEVLGPDRIAELGMGALAAVAGGSVNEPRVIVLRYEPEGARSDLRLGLVGKALTFDAGGLSIKPALRMHEMKGDMAGGAAVIAGIAALAALEVPVRAVGVVASCENLLGAGAFRPGDVLTAANGKTIEIVNTDAEGRLVLADALWYAREQGATHVIDFATLTGAMVLAMGDYYAGFFANDDGWAERIESAAAVSGDHAWRWPLHPRYRRYVDSAYADMRNATELREGSPILAAAFLQEFAGDGPWAHVDMAGTGVIARSRGDFLRVPGGTGYGVRLIVELGAELAA
jgi:leucyl aminopeptidase